MEWELSLHLITDNTSINHMYFFQAGKSQKQEQVHFTSEENAVLSPGGARKQVDRGMRSAFQA